jgi:pimeloyl-ACP methyl ester carboxylesterase
LVYGISSGALRAAMFAERHPEMVARLALDAMVWTGEGSPTLDDSVPTGTYIDMCSKLPVVDPEKIKVPTLIMRGQHDGIASLEDLMKFYAKLPNPDKQFTVMPGISHASFQQKNYMLVYHILASFFAQPAPVYVG